MEGGGQGLNGDHGKDGTGAGHTEYDRGINGGMHDAAHEHEQLLQVIH